MTRFSADSGVWLKEGRGLKHADDRGRDLPPLEPARLVHERRSSVPSNYFFESFSRSCDETIEGTLKRF
jgi:hypothetical protein